VQEGFAFRGLRRQPEEDMAELDGVFYKEIVEQALREFPNECCGVIAADGDGRPVKVFAATNIDASAATYRIDAKDQLRIEREIDDQGWDTWGFYHSHTHSEAYPSPTDRSHSKRVVAFYPDVRFLILSVERREQPVLRSFFIRDGDVTEEEMTVS
jgi:[CysO sulfur-carrier protein]-S-L-cysteine hydrolase